MRKDLRLRIRKWPRQDLDKTRGTPATSSSHATLVWPNAPRTGLELCIMSNIVSAATSSVGKKILNGLTGVALGMFIIVHLAGNLTLFMDERGHAFNAYANFLEELGHGCLLPIVEVGLILVFGVHIATGIAVSIRNRQARPIGYHRQANAGHTSHKTRSSETMLWTGLILFGYVVMHVIQFRIANLQHGYPSVDVPEVKDLFRLVKETFDNPRYMYLYCAVTLILGLHLRHGFWSAWQSIGLNNARWLPVLYAGGVVFGILMAAGFFILPIYLHYHLPAFAAGRP